MSILYKDAKSPYDLRFPDYRKRAEIMALAQTFVAYEQTLAPEQQTDYTPLITDWLQQLIIQTNEKVEAERQYAIASSNLKQLDKTATKVIRQIWKVVTLHCSDEPHEATRWGFKRNIATGNILRPKKRYGRLALLDVYIKKEESRPETERFTKPSLTEVIQLRDELKANALALTTEQNRRESCVEVSKELAENLSEYLEASAIDILGKQFKMRLSTKLQNWGYDIVLKRRRSTKASNAENNSTSHSTSNGTANVVLDLAADNG